ncbi:TIM-barrel domain-containing protein [Opitutus sp. ER46]|uniref:TIM-barrel domain-containing protein n=1 Tax=Opitutus sp. ER46 TaxID=2161864 RepID=UPI000D2FE8F3|nr:TIM-barrel domain-containing protein [Opitutus sp. ER46]PTX91571.1 glycoside hydrolase [Opitutus sp. ER46]
MQTSFTKVFLLLSVGLAPLGLPGARAAASGLDPAGQPEAVVRPAAGAFAFVPLEHGVQFAVGGVVKNVLFYTDGVVRVTANLGATYTTQPSLAVMARPERVALTVEEAPAELSVRSSRLRVVADKTTGALSFFDARGQLFTREHQRRPAAIKPVTISGAPTYEVSTTFTLAPDESLYGLGQYNQSYMDYRGKEVLLVQTNIGSVVPFLTSTRRYGILWDIYSKMTFRDEAAGATLWAESAPAGVDYYFVSGATMDDVIAGYRRLTGAAPMFPRQAYGLFMSKERYKTQARLLEVVRSFRQDRFPLDFIVQDWQYWGGDKDGTWSGMIWDHERFPDPAGLTKTLHEELHVKLMNSIWPSVGNDTALARELDQHGLRFAPLHWISQRARIYDAFSAEGRAIYFKHIKQGLLDVGVDALWMDGTEVEVGGACHDPAEVERDIKGLGVNALGDFTRYLNPYTLVTTQGTYEGQRASGDRRVFTLTRSAWAGQQRYAAVPWSGDTTASWETLRAQIAGGVNVAMAGLPYWSQDTGGFFVNYPGKEKNPEYQELYARWNQFGAFNPIYRIHGTSIEREPYLFRESAPELYASLRRAAELRYALLPYIYSLAWQTTARGYTLMRGLPMDFPDDPAVRHRDDAFMFGPALLVHPVTRAMYHRGDPLPPTIPNEALKTPEGEAGLAVQYYADINLQTPAGKTIDATVEHAWPGPPLANPPPGLDRFDHFSARWSGFLTAPEDGTYEIGAEYDDGARLYLDGKLIVDDWSSGPKRYRGAQVALKKGQPVALRAEYYQGTYGRYFRLTWRSPEELRALASRSKDVDNTMETYLPAGTDWYDFWTGKRFKGGATVTKKCPLDTFPLYARAGSIVPMGPVVQYATERLDAPYEVRVYAGADARFTLYEDDNETYAYERGERATFDLVWHDADRTLVVEARQGAFPGLVRQRELKVVLIAGPESLAKSLLYTGARTEVRFAR